MGRPRKAKSAIPEAAPATISEAEQLADWWRARMEEMETTHQRRVKLLRTVGEHPSPLFAEQVRVHGALGMPKPVIAKLLRIGIQRLEEYYNDDYELGHAEIIGGVAANMIRIATSTTDPQAAKVGMDLLARRGGQEWRPPAQKIQVSDEREKEKNVIDSSKLTYEQRAELRRMIEHVQSGAPGDPLESDESEGDVIES